MKAVNLFADLESHADELAAFGQEDLARPLAGTLRFSCVLSGGSISFSRCVVRSAALCFLEMQFLRVKTTRQNKVERP